MRITTAYLIIIFYGILALMTASAGYYLKPNGGFSMGYLFGAYLSIILWLTVGRKYVDA